jgi:uncharacterized protein
LAKKPGTERDFESLRGRKYALLVTFRRSGEPVPTPVWFGLDAGGRLYFRTEARTAKVKRIRNDSHVRVGPCNVRAKPIGALAEGTARVLPPEENERAEVVIQSNYGMERRIYEGAVDRMNVDLVYVEITPAAEAER